MFFTKAFKGNNAWYMYLVVLLLVFITTQLGGIPFILYKVLSNPETMQQAMSGTEPDTAALTAVTGNAELALMLLAFAAGLGSLFLFARVFQKKIGCRHNHRPPALRLETFRFRNSRVGSAAINNIGSLDTYGRRYSIPLRCHSVLLACTGRVAVVPVPDRF